MLMIIDIPSKRKLYDITQEPSVVITAKDSSGNIRLLRRSYIAMMESFGFWLLTGV